MEKSTDPKEIPTSSSRLSGLHIQALSHNRVIQTRSRKTRRFTKKKTEHGYLVRFLVEKKN